jgi:hypothetical protein
MEYPTAVEIMGLARQIRKLAVERRAREELRWADRGAIPDSQFDDPDFNHNIVPGGRTSDYLKLEEGYEWIVHAFQNAIGPEPSGLDGSIAGMDAAREKLRGPTDPMVFSTAPGSDGRVRLLEMDDSRDTRSGKLMHLMLTNLESWQGDAADAFKKEFAIPLPGVIANQVLMVSALRSALSTNRTVYAMARNDLKGLAKATIDALDFKTGSDGPSFTMTLSVVAGVLAVTAACVSGPGAVVLFTAGASAAGVLKDVVDERSGDGEPPPQGKEYHVGGHTVDMILANTYDLIQEAQRYITISEDTIIRGLQENFATLTAAATKDHFVPLRPSVADIPTNLGYVRDGYHFFPD